MIENNSESYFEILNSRIEECLFLTVPEDKRRDSIKNWVTRLISVLENDIKKSTEIIEIESNFSHFVGKMLSILEGLNLGDKAQKGARKLLLDEIYSCRDAIIEIFKTKEKQVI